MVRFNGRGLLRPYSSEKPLSEPVPVYALGLLLELPEGYAENVVAVRGSRKLNVNDLVFDSDEIILFLATMGG